MCYQTRLIKKREEIMQRFHAQFTTEQDYLPTVYCSAFDFPKTPVITNVNPAKIEFFNWGLIPEWSQNDAIKHYTLNARIETLSKKPSFKTVIQNRCLVLADGFYEWQWKDSKGKNKEKYLITIPNNALFAFAGIYTQWINFDNTVLNTYTIVTTQANELMCKIHNTKQRMPVILKKEDEENWLGGANYHDFKYPYSCNLIATSLEEKSDQFKLFE